MWDERPAVHSHVSDHAGSVRTQESCIRSRRRNPDTPVTWQPFFRISLCGSGSQKSQLSSGVLRRDAKNSDFTRRQTNRLPAPVPEDGLLLDLRSQDCESRNPDFSILVGRDTHTKHDTLLGRRPHSRCSRNQRPNKSIRRKLIRE
jgi:hypothetical protein